MTKIRNLIGAGLLLLAALAVPIVRSGPVAAVGDQTVVACSSNQEVIIGDQRIICDLSIDKQVSVNGGAFVEADTSGDAAPAQIGDTVKWQITVTNNSTSGLTPHGVVYVKDVLPPGVTYGGSYVATAGTYNGDDGSLFANDWILPLLSGGEFPVSTLPATLTITTTAHSTGLTQNIAAFNKYDPGFCDGGCTYVDGDNSNDSDDAWISVPVPAKDTDGKVLGASTLVDTGDGLTASLMAGSLIVVTLGVVAYARFSRKPNTLIQ